MILILPPKQFWLDLWESARGEIIGGLVVAIILALIAIFRETLRNGWRRLRRLVAQNPAPAPAPIQPSPQELVLRVEGLQTPPGPVQAPASLSAAPRTYIPRPPLAGFVARRDESGRDIVERLKTELAPEKEQLIVLWGAGGVGKTTLAAETARAMRDVFAGGIVWITAEAKPEFALATLLDDIATHLGRSELRQLSLAGKELALDQALSTAPPTLVVLDNFETIAPAEQEKCAEWLANRACCPALITSRDEVMYARPVHILAMSLTEAKEFLERLISEARNPRAFEPLNRDKIIQAADRIPHVLQWVVKQIDSTREPQAVLDELSQGEGDAAERVFNRSFNLAQVGEDGHSTLLALSLFVPSASRIALAQVAGFGTDVGRLDRAVQQLVELWLIDATDGNQRLRVQGLTRELTRARFEKDAGAEDYRMAFVLYFLKFARAHTTNTQADYDALEAEKDNLVKAVDIAYELGRWDFVRLLGSTIALPVNGVLKVRGYWLEAQKVNRQSLEAARQSGDESGIATFSHNLSVMCWSLGELSEARALSIESLEITRKLEDTKGSAVRLHHLAILAHDQGDSVEARRLYNESLEIHRKVGNHIGIASTVHQLAILAHDHKEWSEARRLYNESLELERKFGTLRGVADSLHQLGMLADSEGKFEEARGLYNESVAIRRQVGDQQGIASTLHQLAVLAQRQGKIKEAQKLYNESLAIERKLANQMGIAISLYQLATIAAHEKNRKEAARLFQDALTILEHLHSPYADLARIGLESVKALK